MAASDEIDALRSRLSQLEQLVEHRLARFPDAAPPTRIATVRLTGETGRLQDFDGTNYVDAPVPAGGAASDVEITVKPAGIAYAIWRPAAQRWEKLSVGAQMITFTTASALLASDASQDDCPVALVWAGPDPGDTVTIYNEQGFAADAGVDGYAMKCEADGKFKIIQIPCPAGSS